MLTVDDYAKIRVAHRDDMSVHEIAHTFHHSRYKVRQIPPNAEPRAYARAWLLRSLGGTDGRA